MAIDNEELLMELQRVSTMSRREKCMRPRGGKGHGPCGHGGHCDHPGHPGPEGHPKGECHKHEHHAGPGIPEGPIDHPRGNHRNHGGSGRHGQNRILAVLTMQDGTSQKDLAYILGIRPQSLSEALTKLEEHGFVERKKSAEDGRIVNVFLTDKGRDRAEKVAEDRKNNAEDILSVLTEEEKEQLDAILGKLAAKLEENMAQKQARLERRMHKDEAEDPEDD